VAYSNSNTYIRCYIFVASMQHLYTPLTNTYICVAIDPSNATLSNACGMRWYRPYKHLFGLVAIHICVAKGVSFCSVCRTLTYRYQPSLRSSKHDRVQCHPRVQYTSNLALGYEGTYYSRHLSTPSARLAVHMMALPRS
jgi:hypothetical protein